MNDEPHENKNPSRGGSKEPAGEGEIEKQVPGEAEPGVDKAVDDIVKKEGDEVLLAEDAKSHQVPPKPRGLKGFFIGYWRKKWWTIPLTILVILGGILVVPSTRYMLLSHFIKEQVSVVITDSKTNTPVSGAQLQLAGISVASDGSGRATLRVPVGHAVLSVSKQYYQNQSMNVLVSLSKASNSFTISLIATGRQVPVNVTNKLTGQSVAGATIKVLDTEAKTDSSGKASIVLPTTAATQTATISVSGYNDASVKVQVTDQAVAANTFTVTPAGKVYFLSKLSGKIDVVKTNLDGTDRQTVLAGTGNEDDTATVLLASRDWKYLALQTIRTAGGKPEIDLISTSNDQLTNIDQGNVTFNLIGWDNDYFTYVVNRLGLPYWQSNASSIKSFNAQTGKLTTLDNTEATGTDNASAKYDVYIVTNIHLLGNLLVFPKTWYAYPGYVNVPGQQNILVSISPDGSNRKTISSMDAGVGFFGSIVQYKPQELLVQVTKSDTTSSAFYQLDNSGQYTSSPTTKQQDFSKTYSTFLFSPSGNQTFWSEPRDGKNTLLLGDQNGDNSKQIATLSDYQQYGWFTDNYLLVSKNGSELAIMPTSGGTPLKISDYHKPAQSFNGYGGGYGGF